MDADTLVCRRWLPVNLQQMMHDEQQPALSSSPTSPPVPLDALPRLFFLGTSSDGGAYARIERWTMVDEGAADGNCVGNDSLSRGSSSCRILPRYSILRYDGAGGRSSCQSFGQAFHTSSFTRPIVVSGSNDIVLRRPETSRNVRDTCGVCGITSSTCA